MKTVPYTYEDTRLFLRRDVRQGALFKRRRGFVKRNHRKLIDFLSGLDQSQHNQGIWAVDNEESSCGTSACAMGWAILSGKFKGLQYAYSEYNGIPGDCYVPVKNGKVTSYTTAARDYFGDYTTDAVFLHPSLSLPSVIDALKRRLKQLDRENWI